MSIQDYIAQSWVIDPAPCSPRCPKIHVPQYEPTRSLLLTCMICFAQSLLKKRSRAARSVEEQQQSASVSQPLRRCLGPVDVLLLGLGSILGAGGFVLTGLAAHDDAGCASKPVTMVPTWFQAFSAMSADDGCIGAWSQMSLPARQDSYQCVYHRDSSMQSSSAQSCLSAKWHCVHGLHGSYLRSPEGEGAAES